MTGLPSTRVNPWNNKVKQKGEGLLNSIINHHMQLDTEQFNKSISSYIPQKATITQQQSIFLETVNKILRRDKVSNKIDQSMVNIFKLRERISKIDEILNWIQKIQNRSRKQDSRQYPDSLQKNKKQKLQKIPTNSSFIYLPSYCGTTLHEILQDCLLFQKGKQKQKLNGTVESEKLKQLTKLIKNMEDWCKQLQESIL